eukprot:CAMPEP_0197032220 /NCGR_PEP_ID=MMETSP1384-20130603/10953_1 /TAXON_ID=29189 /ORGANISM="Ammonia sp." /LENGTH=278 /DNA_ID=CAMNT_0042461847 /DNA_START=184 /DNA_END=1020 /DNA_ORIENTATION=+
MRHFKIVFLGESGTGKTSIISQKVSYKFDASYTPTIEDYYVKVHRLNIEDVNSFESEQLDANSPRKHSSIDSPNLRRGSSSFSTRYNTQGKSFNDLPCFHCILDIQDTSGSLDYRQNINQWIWRSQVFVIVFDVNDLRTFESIETSFISRIIELRKVKQPPVLLVGNKSDAIHDKLYTRIATKSAAHSQIAMTEYTGNQTSSPLAESKKNNRHVSMDMIEELCNKYNIAYIEVSAKERKNINLIFDTCVKERLFHEAYHRSDTFMHQRANNDMDFYTE